MLRSAALLFVGLVAAGQVAQTTTTLSGVVSDPAGGPLPGARVVAILGTEQRITNTDSAGCYRLEGLAAGTWALGVSLAGFGTARTQISLAPGQPATWNATLNLRTGYSTATASGIDPVDPRLSLGVYSALLRHIYKYRQPEQPAVMTQSLIQPFDELEWPSQLSRVPLSLQRESSTPQARRPVMLRAESFPAGTRLLEKATLRDFPYTSFSRVFFAEDGRGALVVFAHVCGNLCAESTIAWLESDAAGSWTVRASHAFMVS